jgi:hypothetical protein
MLSLVLPHAKASRHFDTSHGQFMLIEPAGGPDA